MQLSEFRLRRIYLPRTPVNRDKKKGRSGMLQNTKYADARQQKGQNVGAASRVRMPPRFRSITLRLARLVLSKNEISGSLQRRPEPPRPSWTLGPCSIPARYHRPENQQGDRRGDGLLPEDTYPRIYRGPVGLRLYLYVQGGLHADDGLEGASAADAHLRPSRGDVRFGHLVILLLEMIHHVLSDGSDVLDKVGKGLGRVESPHLGCLL